MMVFIEIRKGFVSSTGIERMAKDFQKLMATGGLHVGIAGTDTHTMVAIAQSVRELIEIRKFACSMKQVLMVTYEKAKFAGDHITEQERIDNELPVKEKKENYDEL